MAQEIIAYGLLILAVFFLWRKYGYQGKKKSNCDSDCGCH